MKGCTKDPRPYQLAPGQSASRRGIKELAAAHIIFCRNVFSYFSAKTIRRTVKLFYECMPSPGYLFVGTSESLTGLNVKFALQEIGRAFVYAKR